MTRTAALFVEVHFDLICPWCLIGKRHLDTALGMLRDRHPDLDIEVAWHSYPLLPGIPKQGVPYREFYVQRLGSAAAVAARQAQVREAARAAGVEIAFERMEVFPNSLAAHRLVAQAQAERGSQCAQAMIDALYMSYFVQGRNIGDATVLAELASEFGVTPPVEAATPAADSFRGHGVPCFQFNGEVTIEGAQPPAILLNAMLGALALAA